MYIHVQIKYILSTWNYIRISDSSYFVLPRWTQEELKKVIAMLQPSKFDSKDVDPDLHKRMDKAVHDGRIKSFNMRESNADGDQDLTLWARELEDVVLEIVEDPVFKGNQNVKFEMDVDEASQRLFGGGKDAALKERSVHWAETRQRSKADGASKEVNCDCEHSKYQHVQCLYIAYTGTYLYIPY